MYYVKTLILLKKGQFNSHCLYWNDNTFYQSHTLTAAAPISEFLFAEEHRKLLLRKRRNHGLLSCNLSVKKLEEIRSSNDGFAHPR